LKRIGLIGGVSPESTAIYYRLINQAARAAMGGDHSAEMLIYSLDFGVIRAHYDSANWPAFTAEMVKAGKCLDAAGCEVIGICSNTSQLAADSVGEAIGHPLVGLIESLAAAMGASGVRQPLLLGTPFVMQGDFYRARLQALTASTCLVPDADGRAQIDRVIFDELVNGIVLETSRRAWLDIIARGRAAGADGVILGCTEISMLIGQEHTELPVFDTTALHADAIARAAIEA
jgi:aspartate racemase